MPTPGPAILSIVESYLGHRTYGELMRDYFDQSARCQMGFYWYNDDREWLTRVINRLLSLRISHPWMQAQNLDLQFLRLQLGFAYMARRLVQRQLAAADYAVLYFHTQPLAFLSLDLMRRLPTVVSLDCTTAQKVREKTKPYFRWTFGPNIALEQQVFQAATAIVAFSQAARRSVMEDYQIPGDKVHVIYPGVDLSQITPAQAPTKILHQPFTILFIGGDFERKGGHDLLSVFLERFGEQAELHLVTHAEVECDHPSVFIHRNIKPYTPAWLDLYHRADVFVLPTYSEPFGWVFVEAMAAGLPVIATRISAIPEIVSHGETGLLIQPGDRPALAQALQTLIDQPELGTAMGTAGRTIAERKFNAQVHFQLLDKLLYSIAAPL